jgi:hypothetical protein
MSVLLLYKQQEYEVNSSIHQTSPSTKIWFNHCITNVDFLKVRRVYRKAIIYLRIAFSTQIEYAYSRSSKTDGNC